MKTMPRLVPARAPLKKSIFQRIRLLPIIIFFAVLMLGIRTDQLVDRFDAPQSLAQSEETQSPPPEAADAQEAQPQTQEQPAPPQDIFRQPQQPEFSEAEIDTLRLLAARREKLDAREQSLETREGLLVVAEERIDEKVTELNLLEERIKSLIIQYDEQEEARLRSLVKIYENMKPKDAARIFDELDLDILLNVISFMKERRVAPVLAAMDPAKAEAITSEIALQSFIPLNDKTLGAMLEKEGNPDP